MTTLVDRIHECYERLGPGERQVADLLLASPDRMLGFTATELAERAGVSKATVSRFVGKLRLDSFEEFRRVVREEQRPVPGSPLALLAEELDATSGELQRLLAESLRADLGNLERTFATLTDDVVSAWVDLLEGAPKVVFVDFRKNYALAYYAYTLFNVLRANVALLPPPGASAVDGLLNVRPADVVVMFPFRRAQRDQDIVSAAVVERGAVLLTIGDAHANPATRRARLHISCATHGVGVFDSMVAPISVVNLLFTAVANRLGVDATHKLQELERLHQHFQTFRT
jgi:DNA-binding MurR/RpiR family transcriptional regulator